jgi:hypothetical protein
MKYAQNHATPLEVAALQRWFAEVTDTVNSNLTVAAGESPLLLRAQFDGGLRA